jgi:prepilin-type N-terminal cleavage/methylation domain-containing protein
MKKYFGELKEQRGISLVEVLVAMAIFGACAATFIGGLSAGSISTNMHGEEVVARNLAQSQMENIKAAVYSSSGAGYSAIVAPSDYAISISANSSIYSDNNIQKLTVTVSHGGSQVLTLEDYKVNR